jgi:hypothetical protein
MMRRIGIACWLAAAAIPLGGWLHGKLLFALFSAVMVWIGVAGFCVAQARDRQGVVLGSYFATRSARLAMLIVVPFVAWIALSAGRPGAAAALSVAVLATWFWALSPTAHELAEKVNRLLVALVTFVVCIVCAEAGVRIVEYDCPRNGDGWTWGHQVRSNQLGFRERDFSIPKPAGVYRVMVLGDSLTWGAGLSEGQRYTALVNEQLSAEHPDLKIEVLNFGLSGCPTTIERDILRKHIHQVAPDRIVIGFCVNDPQPLSQTYAVELERYRWLLSGPEVLHDLGAKRCGAFLYRRLDRTLRNLGCVPGENAALDRAYDRNSTEWREFVQALQDIKTVSDGYHLPAPVFAPLLCGDGDFNAPNENLRYILKWCRQAELAAHDAGLATVNMEASFEKQGNCLRAVNRWDGHPSAACNEIYAETIAAVLSPSIEHDWLAMDSRALTLAPKPGPRRDIAH